MILDFVTKAREFAQSKKKTGKNIIDIDIENLAISNLERSLEKSVDNIKVNLLNRLNSYMQKSEFGLGFYRGFQNEHILEFRKVNDTFKCKVLCPACNTAHSCLFRTNWVMSNFTNHVRTHYTVITLNPNNPEEIVRLNTSNSELDEILRCILRIFSEIYVIFRQLHFSSHFFIFSQFNITTMFFVVFLVAPKKNVVIPYSWILGINNHMDKFMNYGLNTNQNFLAFYTNKNAAFDENDIPRCDYCANFQAD